MEARGGVVEEISDLEIDLMSFVLLAAFLVPRIRMKCMDTLPRQL
jgi:hypothetical protein